MSKKSIILSFFLAATLGVFALGGAPDADAKDASQSEPPAKVCRVVSGYLIERIATPAPELTTTGRATGHLDGKYAFALDPAPPVEMSDSVVAFTGSSQWVTADGTLLLEDVITTQTDVAGNFTDMMTVAGGSDGYAYATGFIHMWGHLSLATGNGRAQYSGTICVPS